MTSRMTFKTRNLYYLRISEHSVLPVYLYLDERHVNWMSDQVLQHVLSDLRPRILPKLLDEAGILTNPVAAKRAAVDTHRGDNYQFCFFLRRTEPHSVAIKTRNYVARTLPLRSTASLSTSTATNTRRPRRKRKMRSTSYSTGAPSRSPKKQRNDEPIAVDGFEESQDEGDIRTKSKGANTVEVQDEVIDLSDEEDVDESFVPEEPTFDIPMEDEEEKPKPELQLRYKGFGIYGQCLCIVVEPWPPRPSTSRPPQELGGISSTKTKRTSAARSVPTIVARAKTPLFLADENDTIQDDVMAQPAKAVTNSWDDLVEPYDSGDDAEIGDMMAFSQALNMAGDSRPGAIEDDNEMEGAVLLGDADEARLP